MTKWIPRLLGVLVVLVMALFVASTWFSPDVPEVLQRDIDLQVRGQQPAPQQPVEIVAEPPIAEPPVPDNAPALTLTSLEDIAEEGGAPPLLANPQPEQQADTPTAQPPSTPTVPVQQAAVQAPQTPPTPAPQPRQQATAQTAAPPAATASTAGTWIAAGAFGNPDNTKRRVEQLRNRGWPVKVEKIQSGGKTLERVMLGPIPATQVNVYLDELNKMGVQGREIH